MALLNLIKGYHRAFGTKFTNLAQFPKTKFASCFCHARISVQPQCFYRFPPRFKKRTISLHAANNNDDKQKHDDHLLNGSQHEQDQNRTSLAMKWVNKAPKQLQPYLRLMRLDKPIGSWLLYWPCAWSIALASEPGALPSLSLLALFGAGAVCMRGAGCTINDMWDKDIDAKVERTKSRPIASQEISRSDALALLAGQLGVSVTILLQLNYYCILLGIASMGIVVVYPLMKRFINWPQLVLGLAFNWGALMGWAAVKGSCDWAVCLPLYIAGISWTLIYDTIYAHQDRQDDLIVGVKSTAITFGENTPAWLGMFSAIMCSSLTLTGLLSDQAFPFYVALATTGLSQVYQVYTMDINDPARCLRQFMLNRYTGLVIFLGIVFSNFLKQSDPETKAELIT